MSTIPYRGTGSCGERSTLARAMSEVFLEHGFGLDIGMGVFEKAVDRVLEAREAYVDEATERHRLPRVSLPAQGG